MNWSAYTTHRDPVLRMYAEFAVTNNPDDPDDHVHGHVTIDPRSGTAAAARPAQDRQRVLLSDALQPAPGLEGPRLLDRRARRAGDAGRAGQRRGDAPQDLPRVLHLPAAASTRSAARSTCTTSPAWWRCRSTSSSRFTGLIDLRRHLPAGVRDHAQAAGAGARRGRGAGARACRSSRRACRRRWRRSTRWWSRPSAAGPRATCRARWAF